MAKGCEMATTLKSELPMGLMKGYDPKGFFDEMFDAYDPTRINAVILLTLVLLIIWALTRMVDIRKEL